MTPATVSALHAPARLWTRALSGLLRVALLGALASAAALPAHAKDDEDDRRAIGLRDVEGRAAGGESAEMKALARAKRVESIDRLRGLISTAEGDRKAEMLLRLAALYYEQGKDYYFEEMDTYQKAYDQCFATASDVDECDRTLKLTHDESFDWYGKAVKLYEAILRGYPRYARADEATFYLGMTRIDLGERAEAVSAFKQLVKLYPQSLFITDALIQIGEYHFDKNEVFDALRAYKKATLDTEHPRFAFAMYKLAWCYYNVEDYPQAIGTMKQVVQYSMENAESGKVTLEDDALKDLVRFFADAGEMDAAYEYFTKLGKKDLIRSMLRRLAGLYYDQGKFDASVETYRRLIAEDPKHQDNPSYQDKIIEAYAKMGRKDLVLEEVRRLRSDYGPTSSWWRANQSNPEATKLADETIEKALRTTASNFNREARDLEKARHPRAKEAFEQAVQAYLVYFETYNDHPSSYAIHRDFGELLYKLKRFAEAYDQYVKVVTMNPKGEFSRESAENAIFAAEAMVKSEGGGDIQMKAEKITKDVEPVPLSQWEQKLIAACKQYSDLYPSDSKVETAIYKSAFLLYSRYHFKEAADQFRSVISMSPGSKNAEFSAHLILDALKIKEEFVSLRDTSKAFWKQEGLGSSAFKKEMYEIYSSSSFKVIELDYEATKDHGKAADSFLAFYREFADFEKVDVALNNAAAYYFQADRIADSMAVRHIMVDNPDNHPKLGPKSKYYYRQVGALGFDYERLADFERAAFFYDKLLELYPDERKKTDADKALKAEEKTEKLAALDTQAADALFTSAVFRTALDDWKGGIARYESFMKLFPADARVRDIKVRIARTYEDNRDFAEAATRFEAFYSKEKDLTPAEEFFARLHHGRSLLAQGKRSDALKLYKDGVARYKKLTESGVEPGAHTEYAAEMMFELTREAASAFESLTIDSVVKGGSSLSGSAMRAAQKREDAAMKASLTKKTSSLVELEKSYKAIIETGAGEWGLAALIALGQAYENMGQTLKKSPCPFYLTDDQCSIYTMTLEDRTYVQTEKAVGVYKIALDKAFELKLYNDDTAFAVRRLGELRPADYPGLFETIPQPGLTAERVRTFEPEPSLD